MAYEQFPASLTASQKDVFLIDMKTEQHPYFSELMIRGINKTLRQGGSVWIICNKNSYAKGLICDSCGYIPQCKNCDITISYHKPGEGDDFGMCHICKSYYKFSTNCSQCAKGKMKTYGLGIQQIQEYILKTYKTQPLIINSASANSLPKVKRIEEKAITNKIYLSTSLATTAPFLGGESPGLTILLDADNPLILPDYQAQSNCFHLINDTIMQSPHQTILVQTKKNDHPTIRLACKGAIEEFTKSDTERKQQHHYPPFGDICVLMYKNEIEQNVFSTINKLYQELTYLKERHPNQEQETVIIYATPPLIYKAYNKYRYHIIIRGKNIREFVENAFVKLEINKRGFKIDRQAKEII